MQQVNFTVLLAIVAFANAGCATNYVTPAAGVSMAEFTDEDLQSYYEKQPVSPFPANIAIVRVQDSGYVTKTSHGYGHGRYSIVTTRDVESDEAFNEVNKLPLVEGVAPVARLLLPPKTNSIKDLRVPAAKLRADMLLVYSIDTKFTVNGRSLGPLSLISLGLIPNKKAHVTATVAGVLVDVRTGFIYGSTEATAIEEQSATIWSTEMAIDSSRTMAEENAFESFIAGFQELWGNVLNVHAQYNSDASATALSGDASYYRVQFDDR